ncbi:MAG TPA: EAL domain-containing protein [Rhodocyclaceae bacterium]
MEINRIEARLAALNALVATPAFAPHDRLGRLLDFGCQAFGMTMSVVAKLEDGLLRVRSVHPERAKLRSGDEIQIDSTFCEQALISDRPLAIHQASGSEWALHPCFKGYAMEAYLGMRIHASGRVWGTLSFWNRKPLAQPFSADDLQFMELISRWIGLLLEHENQLTELEALGEWHHTLLDTIDVGVVTTDLDGTIRSFNTCAERLLACHAAQVVGKANLLDFHDPAEVASRAVILSEELGETIAPNFDVLAARAMQGLPDRVEWTLVTRNGEPFPGQLSMHALHDDGSHISGYLAVLTDLREHRMLQEASARARENELSRALLHAIGEGVIGVEADHPYRIRFVNSVAQKLIGDSEDALRGQRLCDCIELLEANDGDDGEAVRAMAAGWMHCASAGYLECLVRTTGRGEPFPVALMFTRVADRHEALAVLTIQDISARKRSERRLLLSDKVFEYASEAILITDPEGVILRVNPAFTWLTGFRPDEAVGRKPNILKSGKHDDAFYTQLWRDLIANGHWEGEVWDKRKDGSFYPKWITINAVQQHGHITHYVALFSDITERKENENRVHFLANHDHLTGLPNRRMLEERALRATGNDRRRPQAMALLLLDLDRFKLVNDTLGHHVGDKLLIEVARRLTACVRTSDTVVRVGGDEFVVLIEDMDDRETIAHLADKVQEALSQPVLVEGNTLHTPPSIGIALYPDDGSDIETLLRNADTAMYRVKTNGRNGWAFFTAAMTEEVRERLSLEADLRRALPNRELLLHFQPQFDQGRITATWEALLRWNHPQLGLLPPERFIALAEETGLIVPIGHWVLREACRTLKDWEAQGMGLCRVAVNLSARQFGTPHLLDSIRDALRDFQLQPEQLELEITESLLMDRGEATLGTLKALKEIGVSLTLDDFGTGYSSLGYLKSFCVDRLKIDRSFVRDIEQDPEDAAIVKAVISLAQALNLEVVAEGVETENQRSFLRAQGCHTTQGFLDARPMPAHSVAEYLARRPT